MRHPIAFLFPGQGAQYLQMGLDFYEQFIEAKETFQEAEDILSFPLTTLISEGPLSALTLTKNSQVAIFVVSVALLRVLEKQFPEIQPQVCAGLSLGEYSALVAARKGHFNDVLELVKERALYMHEACETHAGSMKVVLGLSVSAIEDSLRSSHFHKQVWIANLNCPGQVVISGDATAMDAFSALLKERGAKRVLPLEVSGAFHSGLMEEARKKLAPKIAVVPLQNSNIDLVMNVSGDYVSGVSQMRETLIAQVTGTVFWEKGIRSMVQRGVRTFLEIGCGTTLSGMLKRIDISALNVEKISDLDKLAKFSETLCSH